MCRFLYHEINGFETPLHSSLSRWENSHIKFIENKVRKSLNAAHMVQTDKKLQASEEHFSWANQQALWQGESISAGPWKPGRAYMFRDLEKGLTRWKNHLM